MATVARPRTSVWEWTQTALIIANLVWTTLCLGGYLAETMVVSSGLTCVTLAVHLLVPALSGRPRPPVHPAGWLLVPFLVYATANVWWVTPVHWLGWADWFTWVQMTATFWVALNGVRSSGPRVALWLALVALGVAAVALAGYQRFVKPDWLMLGRVQVPQFLGRSSGPFGIPNSLAAYLLMFLPPAGALAFRRGASASERFFFGWVAIVFAVGLGLTISRGAWIAVTLALTLWPLLAKGLAWRRRIFLSATTVALVLAVSATVFIASPKIRERFVSLVRDAGERTRPIMWRGAWNIFCDHPAFGGGAGSYNVLFEKYRSEREQSEPVWAHNDYLNTLCDYGIVGFVLFFGALATIVRRCAAAREPPHSAGRHLRSGWLDQPIVQQGFVIGLLAFALQLFVDFHFKIAALGMAFAASAGLIVSQIWRLDEKTTEVSKVREKPFAAMAWGAGAVLIIGAAWVWILPRYRAEALRYDLRRALDGLESRTVSTDEKRSRAARALEGLTQAVDLDPGNAQAWADRAYAAAVIAHDETGREVGLGRAAEADARRALALSAVVPEFWVRLGVALDMQGQWVEAGGAFSEALRLAPVSARMWFYQAYHLALNPVAVPLARSAVATCLRLDPFNPEAESLRRHLATAH